MFVRLNRLLYRLGLSGMGVLNFWSQSASGETHFLGETLRSKLQPTVLDVGANVGDYTRAILACNERAVVHAFEPSTVACDKLLKSGFDDNVTVVNSAVGSEEGELTLYDYVGESGSMHASAHREVIEELHGGQAGGETVDVQRLDVYLAKNGIERVDLLKIDTEGFEYEVLVGLGRYLENGAVEVIQLEFNEMNVMSRRFFKDFWDLLQGYEIYRLLPQGLLRINEYSPVYCEIFAFQNLVARWKGR
jgi:FkbM family methyltransferase